MLRYSLLIAALLVSGCGSVGPQIRVCGPNDVPIKLSVETQATMTDQQVKDTLAFNESLVDKGCAKPNKG